MALPNKPSIKNVWAADGLIVEPSDSKVNTGWIVERPPHQFQNFLQNRVDQFIKHVNEAGIPVWDAVTVYTANRSYVQGSDGKIYKCLTDGFNQNPVGNPSNWMMTIGDIDIIDYTEQAEAAAAAAGVARDAAAVSEDNAADSAADALASEIAAAASAAAALASQGAASTSATTATTKAAEAAASAAAAAASAAGIDVVYLQDYDALRAYDGPSMNVRITGVYAMPQPQPFAGDFVRSLTDTTSEDDYCTSIVDAEDRRWKRQYTDAISIGWVVGLDDGVAVNTAIAVALFNGISVVTVPKGVYNFLSSETVGIPAHMTLRGEVPGPFDNFGSSPITTPVGAVFAITNTTSPFMTLQGNGSKVENILFYYPNQVAPTAATPTPYPTTIQTQIGAGGNRITRCTFVNSYDAIYIKSGRAKVEDCVIGAFRRDIQVDEALDWVELVNIKCQCMWDVFAGLRFPQNIDAWVLSNSAALDTKRVDSLVVNNFSVFGRYIGHLFTDSGNLALSPRSGYGRFSNVDFDYVAYGLYGISSNATALGFIYTNVTIGANSSGVGTPGQWAFGTVTGGVGGAPTMTISGGAMRGTWAVGLTGCTVPPPAGRIYIENMRGLNPMGAAKVVTPTFPASGATVTNNYPSPVRIGINGGTISNILINGVSIGTGTGGVQLLYPGETIAMTYSGSPFWAWHGL